MKAAPFDHIAATSAEHALQLLGEAGDDGMVLAGGQTLVPMLAMRLARPSVLIDINGIADWAGIDVSGDAVRIKTATRQTAALKSDVIAENLPLLAKALPWVGHHQTRNRGTVGGSIAHGDPVAEIPLVAVALGAEIKLHSQTAARPVAADSFYQGPMMSDRNEDEILVEIDFPIWRDAGRTGAGFHEVAERHGDFAVVSAGAQVLLDDAGVCQKAAIAVGGVSGTPARLRDAEANLIGNVLSENLIDEALTGIGDHMDPADDLHGSADYRRRVARVLIGRALADAVADAGGSLS